MKYLIPIFLVFAVVVLVVTTVATYKSSKNPTNVPANNTSVLVQNNTASNNSTPPTGMGTSDSTPESNVKTFNMIAKKYTYEPGTIEVNKGDKVIIKIKSIDVPHSFTLPEFGFNEFGDPGINAILLPNEEVTIEFIADKTGEFPFGCDVVCGIGHIKMSMDGGKLIVH